MVTCPRHSNPCRPRHDKRPMRVRWTTVDGCTGESCLDCYYADIEVDWPDVVAVSFYHTEIATDDDA